MEELKVQGKPTDRRQSKPREREHPVIMEEEDTHKKKEKAIVSATKDATVEVTVKVKKRRDKSDGSGKKLLTIPEKGFRKGSWGDLLTSSKTSIHKLKDADLDKRTKATPPGYSKLQSSEVARSSRKSCLNDHSPFCQKIPITDDLYLETHTHVKKLTVVDNDFGERSSKRSTTVRHAALLRENENLKEEIVRLRKEVEDTKHRDKEVGRFSKGTSTFHKEYEYSVRPRGQTQGTQTSTACLVSSPKKKSGSCQTDGGPKSPPKKLRQESAKLGAGDGLDSSQLENMRLEKENEALRREATDLLTQVNKARADYLECYNTMKELYQIAANLKQENNNLAQNHQQHQTLQTKLLQALAEKRETKEIMDALLSKQKSNQDIQDDQLVQIRNVIKDVKRTIAQEMEGLQLGSKASSPAEKDGNMNAAFRLEESCLNDTNASEIQHIFSTQPPESRRGGVQEDRSSSTQYLTLAGLSSVNSHYRPSPCADTRFSPRISTPNSSDISYGLSEAAVGANSFRPIFKAPVTKLPEPSMNDTDSEWKKLEAELARSFTSVRNELYQSTSSYSNSSTSSSPNPSNKK